VITQFQKSRLKKTKRPARRKKPPTLARSTGRIGFSFELNCSVASSISWADMSPEYRQQEVSAYRGLPLRPPITAHMRSLWPPILPGVGGCWGFVMVDMARSLESAGSPERTPRSVPCQLRPGRVRAPCPRNSSDAAGLRCTQQGQTHHHRDGSARTQPTSETVHSRSPGDQSRGIRRSLPDTERRLQRQAFRLVEVYRCPAHLASCTLRGTNRIPTARRMHDENAASCLLV
jgi:hypothetical protein